MDSRRRLLVADDEIVICDLMRDMMPSHWIVTICHTGREAYALLTECRGWYDLAVIDISMPDWHGDEAVELARALGSETPVLFVTGLGVREYPAALHKPFTADEFVARIELELEADNG